MWPDTNLSSGQILLLSHDFPQIPAVLTTHRDFHLHCLSRADTIAKRTLTPMLFT
jgi:hypothetical protein